MPSSAKFRTNSQQCSKFWDNFSWWKILSKKLNLVHSFKLTKKYFITDSCPYDCHIFQVPAHQKALFTVSMETGQKRSNLRWSKNLGVHLDQILVGPSNKIWALHAKIGAESPHFQISMVTVRNFRILTLWSSSLTPEDCSCPISSRSVEKWLRNQWAKKGLRLPVCVFSPDVRGCLAPSSKCVYFVCGCTNFLRNLLPIISWYVAVGQNRLFKLLWDNDHDTYAKPCHSRPISLGVDMEQT